MFVDLNDKDNISMPLYTKKTKISIHSVAMFVDVNKKDLDNLPSNCTKIEFYRFINRYKVGQIYSRLIPCVTNNLRIKIINEFEYNKLSQTLQSHKLNDKTCLFGHKYGSVDIASNVGVLICAIWCHREFLI